MTEFCGNPVEFTTREFFFHCLDSDYLREQGNGRRSQEKRESQGKSVDSKERQNSQGNLGGRERGGVGLEKQVEMRKTGTEKKEIEVTDEEDIESGAQVMGKGLADKDNKNDNREQNRRVKI